MSENIKSLIAAKGLSSDMVEVLLKISQKFPTLCLTSVKPEKVTFHVVGKTNETVIHELKAIIGDTSWKFHAVRYLNDKAGNSLDLYDMNHPKNHGKFYGGCWYA